MNLNKKIYGYSYVTPEIEVSFGYANCGPEVIQDAFSEKKVVQLKQVHGDSLVIANPDLIEIADAHFTADPSAILTIKTADCMPIFGFHSEKKMVIGLHAGWRGIENEIVPKSLKHLEDSLGVKAAGWQIHVGPHILFESFEVGEEVAKQLAACGEKYGLKASSSWLDRRSETKWHIDLDAIFLAQLRSLNIQEVNFFNRDTLTDLEFHSYRREKQGGARQLSFIRLRAEGEVQ